MFMSTEKSEAEGKIFAKDLVKKERTRICPSSALTTPKAKSTVNTESTGKRLGIITRLPLKIHR
jgi:hypothetical protein